MDEDEPNHGTNFLACTGEYADAYRPGGFHPLLIGDELKYGRYKIIHKLGHGGTATVWLARDMYQERYVAIKVLQALSSKYSQEIGIHHYLSKDPDFICAPIAKIRSHFTIRGINGRHVCLVLDVHGPSLGDLAYFKFRPDYARDIARQIAQAIQFLHRNDVAFGDLSPSNVLLDYTDLSSFSTEALYKVLGQPEIEEVECVAKDKNVAKHAPSRIYSAIEFTSRDLNLLKPRVLLADLNEAQHVTGPAISYGNGYHSGYASPEFAFGINPRHTLASDIWTLAFLFYETRSQGLLNECLFGPEKGHYMQYLIGPAPLEFCEKAKEAARYRSNEIDELRRITEEEFANSDNTIKHKLQAVGHWQPWHTMTRDERRAYIEEWLSKSPPQRGFDIESALDTGPPPPARLSDEELVDFHDLLSKMLIWEPEKRLTIGQVLTHPWLHKEYNDLDEPSEHWIEKYDTGRTSYEVRKKRDTSYWKSLRGDESGRVQCPRYFWGKVYGYDERGNTIDPFAQGLKTSPKAVEQADDSGDDDEYFITRLLGLPIPKREKVEDDQIITRSMSDGLLEDSERSDDGNEKDEHFVTRLLGLPVPRPGNIEEVEVITTHDWGSSMDAIDTYEGSDDNEEFFVTRLLGLPVPQQTNVENIEATTTQVSEAQLDIIENPETTVENNDYFVTLLLGLPIPHQEHMTEIEVIATD